MTTGRVTEPVTDPVFAHVSVLCREVAEWLYPEPGKRYLDGTLGGGGHSEEILIRSSPDGQVLGLDRDDEAIAAASQRLQRFGGRLVARQASFANAKDLLAEMGWSGVDGVVLDLGFSSHQIDTPERGFSFRAEAPLDMRMDRRQSLNAQEILNAFSADELERIFRDYGEERNARRIARAIVDERRRAPIHMTGELVKIIGGVKARRPPRSSSGDASLPSAKNRREPGTATSGGFPGDRFRDSVAEGADGGYRFSFARGPNRQESFSQMEPFLSLSAANVALSMWLESEGEIADQKTHCAFGE